MSEAMAHYRVVVETPLGQWIAPAIPTQTRANNLARYLSRSPFQRPLGIWRVTPRIRGERLP